MLFLFISHGVYQLFIFKIFKAKYQKEIFKLMEVGIPSKELTLFKFSKDEFYKGKSNFTWIEENEFRYNGEMYDIVKKEIKSDSVYVICFHDKNESVLYAAMDKILRQLNNEDPERAKNLNYFGKLLSQYYSKPLNIEYNSCLFKFGNYSESIPSNLLLGEYSSIDHPPRL